MANKILVYEQGGCYNHRNAMTEEKGMVEQSHAEN